MIQETADFHVPTRDEKISARTGNYFVAAYPPFSKWVEDQNSRYTDALQTPALTTPLILYMHLPFCEKRCDFCYYLSYAGKSRNEVNRYLVALEQELREYAKTPLLENRAFDCVYVGGGTPTMMEWPQLESMFALLKNAVPWKEGSEVTFECAPKSTTDQKLAVMKAAGVTRVSMGVQSMHDDILQASGRVHKKDDVLQAYSRLQNTGFDCVNLDLIVGLPGQTDDTFHDSLEQLIDLNPDSITLYQLEIPANTPLFHKLNGSRGSTLPLPPTWHERHKRLMDGYTQLDSAGYSRISAYTAVREPEKHPFLYQTLQYSGCNMVGIGASSFSYINGVHQQNHASLAEYLESVDHHKLPLSRSYSLSSDEQVIREFILQLKLGHIKQDYFLSKFDVDIFTRFSSQLEILDNDGWIEMDDDSISLTHEGLARVDEALPRFYLNDHKSIRYS